MCARWFSSGFQNDVSLTQYASFSTRSLKPNASNISIVRPAMPSACPRRSGPDFWSTMRVLMSGKAASCAANVSPAGPQPTIRTSISSGSGSECGGASNGSLASEISGSPGLNPLRWNCIASHSLTPANLDNQCVKFDGGQFQGEVDDHVLSPSDTCGGLHLQPGLDSPEPPEAHLIVIARERDHETNLPNASDNQALSQSDGGYLRKRDAIPVRSRRKPVVAGSRECTCRLGNRTIK